MCWSVFAVVDSHWLEFNDVGMIEEKFIGVITGFHYSFLAVLP